MLHRKAYTFAFYKSHYDVVFVSEIFMSQLLTVVFRAPETLGLVSQTISIQSRKNLAQISRTLEQITRGCEFGDDDARYVPVNDYVNKAIKQVSSWLFEGLSSVYSYEESS